MRLPCSSIAPALALLLASWAGPAAAETRTAPTQGTMLIAGDGPIDELERAIPLERTDVFAEVTGFVGRVQVKQVFNNPYRDPIEAIYVFPLPNEAAVTDMTITVGERVIHSKVEKREQARKTYEEAKQRGQTAALLEQERPNIFTQSVANILPGEEIVVEITYDQILHYEDGHYEFVYPMVVGPRYIPSKAEVPDADRISPPVLEPGKRGGHDISLKVALNPGTTITGLTSPSHEIEMSPAGAAKATARGPITVDLSKRDTIPNKDFVLRFDVAGKRPEVAVLAHRGDRDGYFALMFQPPARPAPDEIAPKEIVFVLDVSGSMSGEPIALVKRAMRHAIEHLNDQDTFRIVTFSNRASELTDRALANTPKNVRRALSYVNGIHTGGGTQMLDGVDAALDAPSDGRLRIVCFMSDGYVGNEAAILDVIERKLGADTRIFPFGVGSSVNRYLLDRMAEVGRGSASYILLDDDPQQRVATFYQRIADPVLTHIEVDWAGLQVEELTPAVIPDLFAGQPLWVVGRYRSGGKATVRVTGKVGGHDTEYEVPVSLPSKRKTDAVLAQLWARQRVKHWMARMYAFEDPQIVQTVTELGLDYKLATRYTSFVAVEQTVVNEGGKVRTVEVPVEMPEGVSYDAVFGDERGEDRRFRQVIGPAKTAAAPDADEAHYSGGGGYAEEISLAGTMSDFGPRRWRFGITATFGSADLGDDEGSAAAIFAARATRALTPRVGFGAQLSIALPTADGDARWSSALVEAVVLPIHRLAVMVGLGPALDADANVGLGYYVGTQFRLLRLGPVEVDIDFRFDGAGLFGEDRPSPNAFSAGVSLGF